MRIAIIGRSQMLYNTVVSLYEKGHEINVIITAKASSEHKLTEKDFERLAYDLGISCIITNTLDNPEVTTICKGLDIGISINWISTIQERHISLFRLGILNAHLGDLPRYRGNAAPNWAILKGEDVVTLTIHFMEGGKLDCGKIVKQNNFLLKDDKTIADVYIWAEKTIPTLFIETLNKLEIDGDYSIHYADTLSPQSFRCYPRLPEDGFIDWTSPVRNINNLIRAVCPPFPGAYTYHRYKGILKKLIVLESRIVELTTKDLAIPGHILKNDKNSGESHVQCGEGVLALKKCWYYGENEEFLPGIRWKSIRMRLGVRAEDILWDLHIK